MATGLAFFGSLGDRYLLTRRLERAAALLRNTDRTVADICLMAGFTSVGSFTTSFGRTFGLSPTAYRPAELDVECLEKEPPGSSEACDACRIILLNPSLLLYVLVVKNETNGAWRASRPPGTIRHMEDTDA